MSITIDNTPPVSIITTPAAGSIFREQSCAVKGTAADAGSGVRKVEVSMDGGVTWSPVTGTTDWSYSWTPLDDENYTIQVRATDNAGNRQTPSANISMVVKQRDGDVNDDGTTDIGDALRVLRIVVGLDALQPSDRLHGDVAPYLNAKSAPDSKIDISDVLIILRKAVRLIAL